MWSTIADAKTHPPRLPQIQTNQTHTPRSECANRLPTILGTEEGITALAEFIEQSGAFTKTGERGRDEKRVDTPQATAPPPDDEDGADSDDSEVGEVEHSDDEDELKTVPPLSRKVFFGSAYGRLKTNDKRRPLHGDRTRTHISYYPPNTLVYAGGNPGLGPA
ncbi:hypothetical protein FOMPIDRAFT_1049682 [Fomitopsis schrenkii]|uniref:Uncharacterized protein n=1 Tax=Fomitopsis schrenkii TaxID=2126942 RepID=S8FFZ8_FOMSC|nr:hypothetical protein FOMPIDRAFT_1049682 [Fomitopsis schrenkii]